MLTVPVHLETQNNHLICFSFFPDDASTKSRCALVLALAVPRASTTAAAGSGLVAGEQKATLSPSFRHVHKFLRRSGSDLRFTFQMSNTNAQELACYYKITIIL